MSNQISRYDEDDESKTRSWVGYMREEVSVSWGDAVLIAGCFATGLLDSAVFNVWSCFVSMQTGNTVYVGLGVSGQPHSQPWRWSKSGTSILSFILGSYLFSRLMRYLNPLQRSTIIITLLLQALLTGISALLSSVGTVPTDAGDLIPDNFIVLLPLVLLSIQSAGQCVLSRFLGYNELPSIVLTSAYCDLVMDEKVFSGVTTNSKRNRRILALVMTAAGAILGGFMTKGGDIGPVLWAVTGIKVSMALVWLGWKRKDDGIRLD